jgi:hypothetical protein
MFTRIDNILIEMRLKVGKLFDIYKTYVRRENQNYIFLKNSLIIQEQNTKKNHKRVVVLYVIKNHVNLHKL